MSDNKENAVPVKNKTEYMRNRTLTIKQNREDFLKQWDHLPEVKKFKATVSNGFSAIGLTELELMYIMNTFESRRLHQKKTKGSD